MKDEKKPEPAAAAVLKQYVVTVEVIQRYEKIVEASSEAGARQLAMSMDIYLDDNNLMNTAVGDHYAELYKGEPS